MLKVKVVPDNQYSSLQLKASPMSSTYKRGMGLGQLTRQALVNADGLPAFLSQSAWIIDPYKPWVRYWTVVIAVLLVFTATVTPFEIAFLEPALDTLFWINRVVDLCFLVDMFIQALMGYLDRKRNRWEVRPRVTIKRYCCTWLLPDVVSVVPYDAIAFCLPNYTVAKLKVLRLLRLVRLVRLLRILKTAELFKRWETQIAVSYSHLKLVRFSVAVLLSAHWLACGFFLVVVLEDQPESWITEYSQSSAGNVNIARPVDSYIVALYWSVMTMSTIGYGDVVPKTQYERVYEIFGMMLGASVYAYMVGAICSIVASMNAASAAFNQQMDSLNSFMADADLPHPLRAKLREYFRYRRSARSLHDSPALLQSMSPALRAKVASHTQAKWINTVPFFRPLPEHLKVEMALALQTEAYAPDEAVVHEGDKCNRLFIVDQGTLTSKGRLLEAGAVVGVQHFLLSRNRWSHSVFTVTYCRLQSLDRDTFDEILLRYPVAHKSIRRFALRSSLREDLICYCLGLQHVREYAQAGHQPMVLPSKQDLGGEHLSQDKYHRILALLEEAEPSAFAQLKTSATIVQKHWRGIQARKTRHLLQRLVRASVIQSRAAKYTISSSRGSAASPSPPFARHSRAARSAVHEQQLSHRQHDLSDSSHRSPQPASGVQSVTHGPSASFAAQDAAHLVSVPAMLQQGGVVLAWGPSPENGQLWQDHLCQNESSCHQPGQIQAGDVEPGHSQFAHDPSWQGLSHQPEQNQSGLAQTAMVGNTQSSAGSNADELLGNSIQQHAAVQQDDPLQNSQAGPAQALWQQQALLFRSVLQQQQHLGTVLHQMQIELTAMREQMHEHHEARSAGKVRLKPLK